VHLTANGTGCHRHVFLNVGCGLSEAFKRGGILAPDSQCELDISSCPTEVQQKRQLSVW